MLAPFLVLLSILRPPTPVLAAASTTVTVGYNPADAGDSTDENGKRLSSYLHRKTGYTVKTFVAKDYGALVEAVSTGKVDFAFLPPFSFVQAEDAGAHLLLKAVRYGKPFYYSAIIARADSGLTGLEDLKGKSFAWVDKDSATGYLIPRSELLHRGLDPDRFLGSQSFRGSHDAVVKAVVEKEVAAGATWVNDTGGKHGAWNLYLRRSGETAAVKVVFISGPIPGDALAATGALWKTNRKVVDKITKVLQRMGSAVDGQQILRDLYGIDQMVPARSKDFDSVRAAAREAAAGNTNGH